MKTSFISACMAASVLLLACNGAANKNEPTETTEIGNADTTAAAPVETVYDPDPTDTIPAGQYGINSSSAQTAQLVRLTLQDIYKDDLAKNLVDSFSRKFIFFEYDLNEDGKKEIMVGLRGPYFCGSGGCTQYILDNQGNIITRFTVSDYPVVIDRKKTKDWHDLIIYSGGKNRIAKFDGRSYPANPSTLPALKEIPGDDLPRALNFMNEPYAWFSF